jgi:hypothetical protein
MMHIVKLFFMKVRYGEIKAKYAWYYYIFLSCAIGLSSIKFADILGQKLTEHGFEVGKAFYLFLPVFITIGMLIFFTVGLFVTSGLIYIISVCLGCKNPFEKSFIAYSYINIISSLQLIYSVVSYFIVGDFVQPLNIIRYIIYMVVFIMVYLIFFYTLECTKVKSLLGVLVFIVCYLTQEMFQHLLMAIQ